jgi:hypothetical protein
VFYPLFLFRELCRYLLRKTEKAGRGIVFFFFVLASSNLHRFDFALHMMLFPYCILFNKKKWGEFAGFLFFLAYQILHMFSLDISILCALIYFA